MSRNRRNALAHAYADLSPVEAAQFLIEKLGKTPSNQAFLNSLGSAAAAAARRYR